VSDKFPERGKLSHDKRACRAIQYRTPQGVLQLVLPSPCIIYRYIWDAITLNGHWK